jgi:nitrite reductase (NADH) large subunit
MKRYVVIGGSAAGLAAAEAIRHKSKDAKIAIISDEPGRPYNRPLLSFALDGTIPTDLLFARVEHYYTSWGFESLTGNKAEGLDPQKGHVVLDNGQKVDYDVLLVATGSSPTLLDIPGINLEGLFCFRTNKDMDGVNACLKDTTQAVVIGGGLVGIKVADALQKRGVKVTVLITSAFPLSQIADETSAAMAADVLTAKGVHFITRTSPVEIQGKNGRVARVVLENGETLPCELVVVGKGVVPNTRFLEGSGIRIERGIKTDSQLRTSFPNIFAAGDVAETLDLVSGYPDLHPLWPAAVEQGRIAGCNMTDEQIGYQGTINCNAVWVGELHMISAGITNPQADGDYKSIVYHDPKRKVYKKIVTKDDWVVGMIFVNDIASAGVVIRLIKEKRRLSSVDADLLAPRFNVGQISFML